MKLQPRRVENQTVTPEQAKSWLAQNTNNYRKMTQRTVKTYARDITAGRWKYNHNAIMIAADGTLLDGQHRLAAIVLANKPIVTDVVFGADISIADSLDNGKMRHATDIAAWEQLENTSVGCAIARMLILHDEGLLLSTSGGKNTGACPSRQEVVDRFRRDNEAIQRGIRVTDKCKTLMPGSIAGICFLLFDRLDSEMAERFFVSLGTGAGLEDGSAVHRLRERLIDNRGSKAKLPSYYLIALTIKAWNYFIYGRKMRYLRWKEDEPFPAPTAPGAPEPMEQRGDAA